MWIQLLLIVFLFTSNLKFIDCKNDDHNQTETGFESFAKLRKHLGHREKRQIDLNDLGQFFRQAYSNINLFSSAIQNGRVISSTLQSMFNAMNGTNVDNQFRTFQNSIGLLRTRIRDSIIQYWRRMGLVL